MANKDNQDKEIVKGEKNSVLDNVSIQSLSNNSKKTFKNNWDNGRTGMDMVGRLLGQLNKYHVMDVQPDKELESILLKQKQLEFDSLDKPRDVPEDIVRFSPSSSYKCGRELFYKNKKDTKKDSVTVYPFQRRWQRNSIFIHERCQVDLLYSSKYVDDAYFHPFILESGVPAWESAILKYKKFKHKGMEFALYGMSDGILQYGPKEGNKELIGFEYKTKNTVGAVGDYKLRRPEESHLSQVYSYYLLYDNLKGFVLLYESTQKDGWTKGDEAKADLKAFFVEESQEENEKILDKFASIAKHIKEDELPPKEPEKCLFCPFKQVCSEVGD